MLFILFFLGTVLANNQLESANIFICYNPNNVILNSNDCCNEISSDIKTCLECTITTNQTLIFKPKTLIFVYNGFVGLYVNSASVQLYTGNQLINPLINGHGYNHGIHNLRIDKIESDYVVREFEIPSDVNYCQLNVILGFERSEEYRMII